MNCKHCHKEITLSPSAAERAAKDVTGKGIGYYTSLFEYHTECALELRSCGTKGLLNYHRELNQGRVI